MKQFIGLACLVLGFTTYAQNAASVHVEVAHNVDDDPIVITGAAYRSPGHEDPGVRVAATAMRLWPDDSTSARRNYDEAAVWKGLEGMWLNTGDARYYRYVQHQMERLVDKEGNIRTYKAEDHNPDNVLFGRVLLMLYKVTGQEKYYKAAGHLRQQLKEQVRLDGLYMAQPFFAEYAALFHEDSVFAGITKQFVSIEQHVRDTRSDSPDFRGPGMGRYGMALVDALEAYPAGEREPLLAILKRYATATVKVQDPATGCWWNILDKPGAEGNYLDASASAMFVYTLAKSVRLGYLPASFLESAKKGYLGIVKKFVVMDRDGAANLESSGNVSVNDPRGVGAFLLAAGEMDVPADGALGKGKTVMLDYYFNSEHHKDVTGANIRFHYIWDEMDNNGYSLWGHLFRQYGAKTDSLPVAPTAENLKKASVYIIVDPDNERESPAPNFIQAADIAAIEGWVKAGGVLVLMGNDSANMEFTHFNELAGRFGIHFNFDDYHKVTGNQYEMGAFTMTAKDAIFPATNKVYIKELSTLKLDGPAKAHFTDQGNVITAVARVGKGTVFAVGDPWFYNEYTDGRKLPADFQNFNAARDLTQWLIRQANN